MENNNVLKRIIPVALVFAAILLIALVFSGSKAGNTYATVSNKDEAIATIGKEQITNEEMYEALVQTYGVSMLSRDLDDIIYGPYIAKAKNDDRFDINTEYEKAIYSGLTHKEALEAYSPKDLERIEKDFRETLGINNLTESEFKDLIYLDHAKRLYTEEQLLNDKEYYLVRDVKSYYEYDYYNDVTALTLKFDTTKEALETLNDFGVTATKDGKLNKNYYIDGKLINSDNELYPTDEETLKSLALTDEEILEVYVAIYNSIYPTSNVSLVDGKVLNAPVFEFSTLKEKNYPLSEYIFLSLNTNTNKYTTYPVELPVKNMGTENEVRNAYLVFKLDGDNANNFKETFASNMSEDDFKDLVKKDASEVTLDNQDLFNELITKLAYKDASSKNIQNKFFKKAVDKLDLNIHDEGLGGIYSSTLDKSFNNRDLNNDYVYSYTLDGKTVNVTADEFYNSLLTRYGANKLISLLNNKVYVSNEKLLKEKVTPEMDNYFKTQIQNYKQAFIQGQYQEYGYTKDTKTWENFMFEMLGAASEKELYNNMVTEYMSNIYLVNHYRIENKEQAYQDMKDYYDNSFNVDTHHLLVYADTNHDNLPDRVMSSSLEAKAYELSLMLNEKLLNAENFTVNMLANLVNEYNNASVKDSVYGEFKALGLALTTEKLDNVNQDSKFEEAYLVEAKNLYDLLISNGKEYELSTKPVKSSYGFHILYATSADKKIDAYPKDDNMLYPTPQDIEKYYNDDKSAGADVNLFINKYYVKALENRVNSESTLFMDSERERLGVTINNASVDKHYNEIVAIHKAQANK